MRTTVLSLFLALLTGCGPSQEDFDALERRVSALERGRGGVAKKAKKRKKKRARGGKRGRKRLARGPKSRRVGSRVALDGDADTVVLIRGNERHVLPTRVAPGTYTIVATFPDAEPTEEGELEVVAMQRTRVTCTADTESCTTEAIERGDSPDQGTTEEG